MNCVLYLIKCNINVSFYSKLQYMSLLRCNNIITSFQLKIYKSINKLNILFIFSPKSKKYTRRRTTRSTTDEIR